MRVPQFPRHRGRGVLFKDTLWTAQTSKTINQISLPSTVIWVMAGDSIIWYMNSPNLTVTPHHRSRSRSRCQISAIRDQSSVFQVSHFFLRWRDWGAETPLISRLCPLNGDQTLPIWVLSIELGERRGWLTQQGVGREERPAGLVLTLYQVTLFYNIVLSN